MLGNWLGVVSFNYFNTFFDCQTIMANPLPNKDSSDESYCQSCEIGGFEPIHERNRPLK